MMDSLLRLAALTLGAGGTTFFLWAAAISAREGEGFAVRRMLFLALLVPLPYFLAAFLPGQVGATGSGVLVGLTAAVLMGLLLPVSGGRIQELGVPVPGFDERDIMFSRAELVPGSDRFEEYYRTRPDKLELDKEFRRGPGLLSPGAVHFHRYGFAAADAAFWTIEMLRPFVDGEPEADGAAAQPPPEAVTRFLREWVLKMGAHSVGVTELRDYHLYSYAGRGEDYGKEVTLAHTHALALTVEMGKEMVDRAPRAPTAMESAFQYLRSGVMAVQVADLIRRLGYRARAHIDGRYRVICPLVARDAGLGEMGRMGLIMTPRLGPRVRIAVVTTDLPLAPDPPAPAPSTIDFCLRCRKCADSCPSRAIPFGDPEPDENGVLRWRIDSEACFTLWGRLGTDCARCMAVCPYSHPDNRLHSLVRWGIRNNAWFRQGAVWLDDFVYGRRPGVKGELEWMKIPESEEAVGRTDS